MNIIQQINYLLSQSPIFRITVIISTPNIGFIVIRLMLLFGSFNYGSRGILDKTHTRLFTFSSFKNLLLQSGFKIINISGVPVPLPLITGDNKVGSILLRMNKILIFLMKNVFSYQIFSLIRPNTSVELLLDQAKSNSSHGE